MLYVTTRNNRDAYTVHHALTKNRCSDGGQYLPFRHPHFSEEELEQLFQKSSGHCIAAVLNRLFNRNLTGWDVEFAIGRNPVRLKSLQHKILVAEAWHTPGYRFDTLLNALSGRIAKDCSVSEWIQIAVRSAILFGIFSDLRKQGISRADISCVAGDFLMPISAWYARHWGLPIGNIICTCNENNSLWDLHCHGQLRTDAVSIPTILPEADVVVPHHLERLIYEYGGVPETLRYLDCCRKGMGYYPSDSLLAKFSKDFHLIVVSSQRITTLIPSVHSTHGHLLSSATALAYAGLMDHRAQTGATGCAIVWSEISPIADSAAVSRILGIPEAAVFELI